VDTQVNQAIKQDVELLLGIGLEAVVVEIDVLREVTAIA
jgi:hypothetical protein